MPTVEEMFDNKSRVREWYKQKLIRIHGNGNMALVNQVVELTTYEDMLEEFAKETGTYTGPYSAF